MKKDGFNLNGLALAYLGDAYYELSIRSYLIKAGHTKVNLLHKLKVKYVSSKAQAHIMKYLLDEDLLNEVEIEMYKKGRNASHFGRKNVDRVIYQEATGFESLIGYLSIYDETRCQRLIEIGIDVLNQGENYGEKFTK